MSIQVLEISKSFTGDQDVLKSVTLEVQTGELFVLLGASGSGKSSLLRIIAGLSTPNTGQVLIHGEDVTNLPPQQRNVGFVFQNYSLFQHMSIADNVGFALDVQHKPHTERNRRIAELLDLIGLAGYADRFPRQLSGGQQQRVALARALAHEPRVLLLDEPFGALDAKIRAQLRQSLREIQQRLKVTTILVTHDQDEAFELADRIGIIDHGQLLEIGQPNDLYRHPRNRFTANFLGTVNVLRAERDGNALRIGQAELDAERMGSGSTFDVLLRPEQITLAVSTQQVRGQLLGSGIVESVTFMGAFRRVTVALQGPGADESSLINALILADDQATGGAIVVGQPVWVGVRDYSLLPV